MGRCLALALASLCFILVGCGEKSVPAPEESTEEQGSGSALQDSWMYLVAAQPEVLAPYEQGVVGEAWMASFHNDLRAAIGDFRSACQPSAAPLVERAAAGFPCVGLARVHIELSLFYAGAAALHRVALRQFYAHRAAHRSEVLPSKHEDYFYGLVLVLSGATDEGVKRLLAYTRSAAPDPALVTLADRIAEGVVGGGSLASRIWGFSSGPISNSTPPLQLDGIAGPYAARLAFSAAIARQDVQAAGKLLRSVNHRSADIAEQLDSQGSGVQTTLKHTDPSFLRSLSRYHALLALEAIGNAPELGLLTQNALWLATTRPPPDTVEVPALPAGLPLVLFSSYPSPRDRVLGWWGHDFKSGLERFRAFEEVVAAPPSAALADLDPFVQGSNRMAMALGASIAASGPTGQSMDADMGLSERFRGYLLRSRARMTQMAFDVRLETELGGDIATAGVVARSMMELALDKNPNPPQSALKKTRISYRNDPQLLIELARAELDTKRPYEANDYVRPLTAAYPELIAVRDALTILDTAWNPPRRGSVQK